MILQPEDPRVIPHDKTCHLLVGKCRYTCLISAVCNIIHLFDCILPPVHEHGATRAVGHYHIGPVRFHRLEFLTRSRKGISPVCLYEILSEAEAAAVTPLRIVDDITAPRFNHTHPDMREFRTADPVLWKHLCVMTAYMFNHFQRLAGGDIVELILCLAGYLIPESVNYVTGMGN